MSSSKTLMHLDNYTRNIKYGLVSIVGTMTSIFSKASFVVLTQKESMISSLSKATLGGSFLLCLERYH